MLMAKDYILSMYNSLMNFEEEFWMVFKEIPSGLERINKKRKNAYYTLMFEQLESSLDFSLSSAIQNFKNDGLTNSKKDGGDCMNADIQKSQLLDSLTVEDQKELFAGYDTDRKHSVIQERLRELADKMNEELKIIKEKIKQAQKPVLATSMVDYLFVDKRDASTQLHMETLNPLHLENIEELNDEEGQEEEDEGEPDMAEDSGNEVEEYPLVYLTFQK